MIYTTRVHEKRLFKSFANPMITGILGPRRVGKSTLVNHYLDQLSDDVVRLNMDRMKERDQIKAGQLKAMILTQIERHLEPGKKVWVAIDEAQKCPDIFEQIKLLYDQYKGQDAIKFILTGSALLELHRLSAESLAGRIQLYYLSSFSLSEALKLKYDVSIEHSFFDIIDKQNIDEKILRDYMNYLLPYSRRLKEALSDLLIWGGLPEVIELNSDEEKLEYLANYLQTYLEKDVHSIESISDLSLYRNLMDILAEQTGSIRDDNRIMQALGCHRDTLNKYRGYLQSTLMYQDIQPYINSSLKRLVKSPKGYLINNGLISFLQGIHNIDILVKTGQIGHRLEGWFLNESQIWLNKTPGRHSAHYWRTSSGIEVDFVIQQAPHLYAFEVTYASIIEKKKIRNLESFKQYEPKNKIAVYVYMGDFKWDAEKNIIFIPAWGIL